MDLHGPDEQIRKELEELRRRVAELESGRGRDAVPCMDESYFQTLVERAYDGILVLDADMTFRYVSPSITRICGFDVEEFASSNALDYVHPDDLATMLEMLNEGIIEPGRTEQLEYRTLCKDGSYIMVQVVARNLLSDPVVAGIVVNLRDVSTERRMEKELKESEERYRYLVENLNDVIYTVDGAGIVTYISPAIERMGGYKAEELVGRPFADFVYPQDLPALLESIQRTISGSLEPHEFRVLSKDGRLLYVLSSNRLVEKGGEVAGLIGIMSDLTARKAAEDARRRTEEHFKAQIRRNIHYYRGSS